LKNQRAYFFCFILAGILNFALKSVTALFNTGFLFKRRIEMYRLLLTAILLINLSLYATTTGSGTSRNLTIDGVVSGQSGAANGTNGGSWEQDEALPGNGVTWYMSWDDDNLYLARANGGNNGEPIIVYIQAKYPGAVYSNTPQNYDNFIPDFSNMTTGGSDPSGINFVLYTKTGYDEFRYWNGSSWSEADNSLTPVYSGGEFEIAIPWNKVTNNNGKPSNIRVVFYQTNGNGASIFAYAESPIGNPGGSVSNPTISKWWGGYSVIGGVSPAGTSDNSLPVSLTSFTATAGDAQVTLRWRTESEIANEAFLVQRSTNTVDFATIAEIAGHGTTNEPHEYQFEDRSVVNSVTYYYRLADRDFNGNIIYHPYISATPKAASSGIDQVQQTATRFALHQNYPNPFNPSTTITFEIPAQSYQPDVDVAIYDVTGQLVKTLFNGTLSDGVYQLQWDGTQNNGLPAPSGIYFVQLRSGFLSQTKKMILNR
jgi:hypothetical protein